MKMKRFLAGLLLLAMAVTSLGFRPVAAHEDAVVARWTTKADLAPADYEVQMKLATGSVAEQEVPIQGEQSFYQDSDVVTVVVELEEAPLLARAGDEEIQSFVASAQGQTLSRTLLDSHEAVKAQLHHRAQRILHQAVLRRSGCGPGAAWCETRLDCRAVRPAYRAGEHHLHDHLHRYGRFHRSQYLGL